MFEKLSTLCVNFHDQLVNIFTKSLEGPWINDMQQAWCI